VRAAAVGAGARAWVFAAETTPDMFIEFIEWRGETVLSSDDVAAAITNLNQTFPSDESETWREAQI
jgi:hypothetical protein